MTGTRAVVFGGAGFLGSFVADALAEGRHSVTVFDRVESPHLRPDQTGVVGDILDQKAVEEAVSGSDVVYNYAGIADIDQANQNPLETVRYNILGNTFLLEAARKAAVKRFVFASTLYVYSQAGAFYRSSKQASELVIEEYERSYGLAYTILRYGSLYGPRATEGNWIYAMLKDCVTKSHVVRYGDGEEIREYIHVRDAAQSSVDILAPDYENATVIITGQQSMRIKDLLTMVDEMMGKRIEIEYRPPESAPNTPGLHYEVTPYSFNPRVAQKLVRTSFVDLGQGLLELISQIHAEHQEGE